MALFKYKAKDKEGKIYERTIEAKGRLEIYSTIREEGGTVVSIKESRRLLPSILSINIFGGVKIHEKITFAKNLALMMEAGLPLVRALSVMSKQSRNPTFKRILNGIEEDVSHGRTLSDSLSRRPKIFSNLLVSMVRAGEESGNVSKSLSIVASEMEKSNILLKKARGAMIYPIIIVLAMIAISILLLIFMVPTLTATFEGLGAELPFSTRVVIAISSFLIEHTLIVMSALSLLLISTIIFLKSRAGRELTNEFLLRVPIVNDLIREFQSARTARTLSSLLSAGVEIVVAMDVSIDVMQNHLYKKALERARTAVEKGESVSKIFIEYEKLYPPFVGEMVAVGEETGKIADMLSGVADYYENEVDQKTKNLSTIIEPALMIIVGVGVAVFAISMLAPTYSLVNYI